MLKRDRVEEEPRSSKRSRLVDRFVLRFMFGVKEQDDVVRSVLSDLIEPTMHFHEFSSSTVGIIVHVEAPLEVELQKLLVIEREMAPDLVWVRIKPKSNSPRMEIEFICCNDEDARETVRKQFMEKRHVVLHREEEEEEGTRSIVELHSTLLSCFPNISSKSVSVIWSKDDKKRFEIAVRGEGTTLAALKRFAAEENISNISIRAADNQSITLCFTYTS